MLTFRHVREEDKAFWYSLDRHLPEEEFVKKVRDAQGYIHAEQRLWKASHEALGR